MAKVDVANLWQYNLRKGNSKHPSDGACLFDAGMWLVYGKIGDNPPCSCPIIRAYAIGLNDHFNDQDRQLLKPFILRVVGNRDPAAEAARLRFIVLETARRVVGLNLPDNATYTEIGAAAEAAAWAAAWAAGAAAEAAAEAAWAAWAAEAAEAAWAAEAAAEAAWAAAEAAARAAAEAAAAIQILDGALQIGKQSPEYDEAAVITAVSRFELARVK